MQYREGWDFISPQIQWPGKPFNYIILVCVPDCQETITVEQMLPSVNIWNKELLAFFWDT